MMLRHPLPNVLLNIRKQTQNIDPTREQIDEGSPFQSSSWKTGSSNFDQGEAPDPAPQFDREFIIVSKAKVD